MIAVKYPQESVESMIGYVCQTTASRFGLSYEMAREDDGVCRFTLADKDLRLTFRAMVDDDGDWGRVRFDAKVQVVPASGRLIYEASVSVPVAVLTGRVLSRFGGVDTGLLENEELPALICGTFDRAEQHRAVAYSMGSL